MSFLEYLTGKQKEVKEDIEKNSIVVFLIPNKIYQDRLLRIAKSVASRFDKVLYISLNKPAEKIIEILKRENIDARKFLFIDAITKRVKADASDHGIIFISPPADFDKFSTSLNQIIEKERVDGIIFDSLSAMLVYQDESTVIRFMHDFTAKLMVEHEFGGFICLLEDVNSALVKNMTTLADKVIDMGDEKAEIRQEDSEVIIAKLEKEISSIKQAYASKLISEQTYLHAKERILDKLRRLRKIDIRLLYAKGFVEKR